MQSSQGEESVRWILPRAGFFFFFLTCVCFVVFLGGKRGAV